MRRRHFIQGAAAGAALLAANQPASPRALPPGNTAASQFFKNFTFNYTLLISLGQAYSGCGEIGRLLYAASQIKDGDYESAYQAFYGIGEAARRLAESARHTVSRRQACLWAANYYYASTYFLDGTADPGRFLSTWKQHRASWEGAAQRFDPPVERVMLPYEGGVKLVGWFFRVDGSGKKRPLMIMTNGSDGSVLDMWTNGGKAAIERGWNVLTYDGPGQGAALWLQKLYFRPDWERVVTPIVDYALTLPEVDSKRIVLQGISQAGYWVPRAAAFEHRLAAAICDPGCWDVSKSWTADLPASMMELLKSGNKKLFDEYMLDALKADPDLKATLDFRMRPYGTTSPFEAYKKVMQYNLTGIAEKIKCPTLITSPQNESFWPGQSEQLYAMLKCPKELIKFTVEEGADLHCEPKNMGLRDLRIYDWLYDNLKA